MTEGLSSFVGVKRIPIRDRACSIGDLTGVNGYHANRASLKLRFAEGGYVLQETPHFLLCTREKGPSTILVHWLAPSGIDADIGNLFMQELKPLGLLSDAEHFGQVFGVVVCSLFPHDPQHALRLYAANTLRRYRSLLEETYTASPLSESTIHNFAAIYQRVFDLRVGERFLDAGCSFGFLPLLMAERFPLLKDIVGLDIETDSFPTVRAIAQQHQVRFLQADLIADEVVALGRFETVSAIHILEHFAELEMYRVLTNLLQLTLHRLIIAVPYEQGEPEVAYGHAQLFTPNKLEAVGQWCLEQLGGQGSMAYEECAGGLLLIERDPSTRRDPAFTCVV
jgi:SAM-dependent methyltransferase